MKKVIQFRAFRESEAARPAPESTERTDVDPRQQLVFKTWLESEADAAAIIYAMSFRVMHKSDLAIKARNYASRLRLYVARLSALLPPHMQARYGACTPPLAGMPALTPKNCEQATFILVEYLLHHAESAAEITLTLQSGVKREAGERLSRRMREERLQLADWIIASGYHSNRGARTADAEDAVDSDEGSVAPTSGLPGSIHGNTPQNDATSEPQWNRTSRISYNPPQIVRWM